MKKPKLEEIRGELFALNHEARKIGDSIIHLSNQIACLIDYIEVKDGSRLYDTIIEEHKSEQENK